jgi:hypothetical protein
LLEEITFLSLDYNDIMLVIKQGVLLRQHQALQNALEMMIFIATKIEVLSDIVNDIRSVKNASSNL